MQNTGKTLVRTVTRRGLALVALAAGAWLAGGCGHRQTRSDVYMNLMTPLQQAEYRLLEAQQKPIGIRLAYLQGIEVYQAWAEQPKKTQEAILRREVLEGMTPVQVRMAWGEPDGRRDVTLPVERAEGLKRVIWDYRLNTRKSDSDYERSVCFLNDRVLWVRQSG